MHLGLILWLMPGASAADCTVDGLLNLADSSVEAFTRMDAEQFDAARKAIAESLACQTQPLAPEACARLHVNRGLAAFLEGDAASTILAFRAALDADPGTELSEAVAPAGHPLLVQFRTAEQWSASTADQILPKPRSGWLQVDGARADTAPTDRPFVFQRLDASTVESTAYVLPGGSVPTYPAAAVTERVARGLGPKAKRAMTYGGVALGTVSIAAYAGAFAARSANEQAELEGNEGRIYATRALNRGLTVGGVVGVLAGTGLVVVAQL